MSIEKNKVKEAFIRANLQMQAGCGNCFCLNPFCKAGLKAPLTPTEISIKLLELCKTAQGHDLSQSKEFVFCEPGSKVYLKVPENLEYAEVLSMFGNPVSLGSSFRIDFRIDWDSVQQLYRKIEEFCNKKLLTGDWIADCLSTWAVSSYTLLFFPHAFMILLASPGIVNLKYVSIVSCLLSSHNLFSVFSQCADLYDGNMMKLVVNKVKRVVAGLFRENAEDVEFSCFANKLDLLQALYLSNERFPRLSFQEFYVESINTEVNLKVDFKYWYSQINKNQPNAKKNAFFWYPWAFDIGSKAIMLGQEIKELMLAELHNAWIEADLEIFTILEVNRNNLLEDTLLQLNSGLNLKKPLKIHFVGEEGVDEGGVKKEFFQLLVKEIFDPGFGMFCYYEEQRRVWFNPDTFESGANFEIVGKIVALAVYNSTILDIHLPMVAYKKLLGHPVNISDLEEFNPSLVKGLKSLQNFEGDIEQVFCLNFSIETSFLGQISKHDLIPGGSLIPVTQENLEQYIALYTDWWLNKGIEKSFEGFKRGFLSVCNGRVLASFKASELELIICGEPVLDFYALEKATKYEGFSKESVTIQYFWQIIHSFSKQQQKRFLSFVSGSDRAPIGGLGKMQMTITRTGADTNRLMTAHTCFNYLILPEYTDKGKMMEMMLMAIENASGFGLR